MDTWGLLPKSQIDPQTIEELVDAKILAHKQDPDSHVGENESLAVHREFGTLDHKPGAVLGDKWTMSELEFSTTFDILSLFGHSSNIYASYPGFHLENDTGTAPKTGYLDVDFEDRLILLNFDKDFIIQVAFSADLYSGGNLRMDFGFPNGGGYFSGIELFLSNAQQSFTMQNADTEEENDINWPTFEHATPYVVRIQNVVSEAKIYIYINGELLGTLDRLESVTTDATHFKFFMTRESAVNPSLDMYSLFFAQQQ